MELMLSGRVDFVQHCESQDSPSEEFPDTEASSKVWEESEVCEASDHTEAVDMDAEAAMAGL
jgi:hypothetical protein